MRRTFQEAEGHNNHERWLLTYADMITLLTAFFLMLYSMSVMSKGKFSELAVSVKDGFHGVMQGGGRIQPNGDRPSTHTGLLPDNKTIKYSQAMRDLHRYVEQNRLSDRVTTHSDSRGITISLVADNMLFERGKAQLSQQSGAVLSHVADILKASLNNVAIEGHTCDIPIHTAQFPSNWELSSARASVVLRYFTEVRGLPESRFVASGYADTRPLPNTANTSEAHRARNRRVDIVLLKTDEQREAERARQSEIRRISANGSEALPSGAGVAAGAFSANSNDPVNRDADRNGTTGGGPSVRPDEHINSAIRGDNIGGATPDP